MKIVILLETFIIFLEWETGVLTISIIGIKMCICVAFFHWMIKKLALQNPLKA